MDRVHSMGMPVDMQNLHKYLIIGPGGRQPERIELILEAIRTYWKANPDMRLGQIVVNAARYASRGECAHQMFNMEDYEFIAGLGILPE